MNIIFSICCAFLQLLAWVTGLTYLQTSMLVNVYGQGLICVLASMPALFYMRKASLLQRVLCIGNIVVNVKVMCCVFLRYYAMPLEDAGNLCMHDLTVVAPMVGMTYIQLNIFVSFFVFLVDLFISRILYESVANRNKRVMVAI